MQVEAFNYRVRQKEYLLHAESLVEPFLGRPDAPIVLLNGNPGFKEALNNPHGRPEYIAAARRNLLHEPSEYPFFLLDPVLDDLGFRWWKRKLNHLIQRFDRRTVAQSVLCVEYFPYRSRRFRHRKLRLPSQDYSFHLVREAIHRNALIVRMRMERPWFEAVPELLDYPRLHRLSNVQNPALTRGNCSSGFDEIVEIPGCQQQRARAA